MRCASLNCRESKQVGSAKTIVNIGPQPFLHTYRLRGIVFVGHWKWVVARSSNLCVGTLGNGKKDNECHRMVSQSEDVRQTNSLEIATCEAYLHR